MLHLPKAAARALRLRAAQQRRRGFSIATSVMDASAASKAAGGGSQGGGSKWPRRIALASAAAVGGVAAWATYVSAVLGRDLEEEVEFTFPSLHGAYVAATTPAPEAVFTPDVARARRMDPALLQALGDVFLNIDANVPEGMTRANSTAVLQELGYSRVPADVLDEAFAAEAAGRPSGARPPPARVRPDPAYEPGEMPALDNAERAEHQALLRPQPREQLVLQRQQQEQQQQRRRQQQQQQQQQQHLGSGGRGAEAVLGLDAFVDAVAKLRDAAAAGAGSGGDPDTDAALLARIAGSQHLAQLRKPYDAGLNGRAPHHVETWRFLYSALTHDVPPKAQPGGSEQLDLRRIEGRTGIQKVPEGSDNSNATSQATATAVSTGGAAQASRLGQQQQQQQGGGYGGSGGPISIPDLDDEVAASEAEMIELELRNVRASMQRASGAFRARLAEQERALVKELAEERAKQQQQ